MRSLRVRRFVGVVVILSLAAGCRQRDPAEHAETHPGEEPDDVPPGPANPTPSGGDPVPLAPPKLGEVPARGDGGRPSVWRAPPPEPGLLVHSGMGRVQGVGVDEAGNVWAVNGSDAIYVMEAGQTTFRELTGPSAVGRLAHGERPFTVCGGAAGEAYVGYEVPEIPDPLHPTPEQRAQGDVDVLRLSPDGGVSVRFHYDFHNNNSVVDGGVVHKRYDETRSIMSCVRINDGPYAGEVYFGSNHGVTRVKEEVFGDHRHPTFDYPACPTPAGYECDDRPEAIGYVRGLNLSNAGNLLIAASWMFAEVAPIPYDVEPDIPLNLAKWTLRTHRWSFIGPPAFPLPGKVASGWMASWHSRWPLRFDEKAGNRAIAQTPDGRYWVASLTKGLVWFDVDRGKLSPYVEVEGEPGAISALVANPDGSLWVGTEAAGLWRYEPLSRPTTKVHPPAPELGTWTRFEGLPSSEILRLYAETRSGRRQLYIGTASGLAVYTE